MEQSGVLVGLITRRSLVQIQLALFFLFLILVKVMTRIKGFEKLVELVERLRSEDGCPWDRQQTIASLKEDVLSEADELREAIDKQDYENVREEIGDLIWGLVLMTQVAKEEGRFDLEDVFKDATDKLVRRHPHVFGSAKVKNGEEANKLFYQVKENEKRNKSGPTQN